MRPLVTTSTHYVGDRRQDWRTPPEFFRRLHEEFQFTLDGASDGTNGLLPRAAVATSPLADSWAGERVFCNPPWSNIAPFIELAAGADLAVLLVPARTNSRWFNRAIELGTKVRYFMPRVRFINPATGTHRTAGGSPVDCVLLIFGKPDD